MSISILLEEPCAEDPLNDEAGKYYLDDFDKFDTIAKEMVEKNAKNIATN